ncbi:hypothetical protein CKAN_02671100 [Cinnamomum micranthum f. kanehirae]|uniref:UspA domain-containing protein n=1 Tax=Cinnamomum micranthum f. kanehirae TaxID=337451 RepID=A0A443Q2N5_9MAGN|nr:hypothetical protein CKAN_02671100 [Cinnamomum micranthum f. kanehirae]
MAEAKVRMSLMKDIAWTPFSKQAALPSIEEEEEEEEEEGVQNCKSNLRRNEEEAMKMNMDPLSPSSVREKPRKKVMVVAEPGRESAGALDWAISHALVEHDELILLQMEQSSILKRRALSAFLRRPSLAVVTAAMVAMEEAVGGGGGGGENQYLEEMKKKCEKAKPKVRVQIARAEVEGKNRASAIISQTNLLSVDVLVVGQRRNFLGHRRPYKGLDTAEYLIENSVCPCVGVQKKHSGGYLLNTKTRKNFWLLA